MAAVSVSSASPENRILSKTRCMAGRSRPPQASVTTTGISPRSPAVARAVLAEMSSLARQIAPLGAAITPGGHEVISIAPWQLGTLPAMPTFRGGGEANLA